MDENLYRQISSNSQDLFKLPIDLFIEKVKGAWIGEELIKAKHKPSGKYGNEDNWKSGKGFQKTFENKNFNRNQSFKSNKNEVPNQKRNASNDAPVCFECQKPGHYRKDCPKLKGQRPPKIPTNAIEGPKESKPSGNGKVDP